MNRLVRPALIGAAFAASTVLGTARAQTFPTQDPSYTGTPVSVASTAQRFGEPGQIVIANNFAVDFSYQSSKPPSGSSTSSTNISIAPVIDLFVAPRFSVGGRLAFEYAKGRNVLLGDVHATTFQIGPEVGYAVPLSPSVSLYPRLGAGYSHVSVSTPNPIGGRISTPGWSLNIFALAPVLFHPFDHLFLGGGPTFAIDIVSKVSGNDASKLTGVGLSFVIGGWF
jgi:hypothetical protein